METDFQNVKVLQNLSNQKGDVTSCDFTPNYVLVTSSSDKTVRVWDWSVGSGYLERACSPLLGHKYAVTCVKVSPQGCMLASSSIDGTTVLWNMKSGIKIHVFVQINGDAVRVCRFSGDSAILATASDNGAICIWNIIHKSLVRTILDNEGSVQALTFTPDSKYLISGCSSEKIKIWLVSNLADTVSESCLPLFSVDNAHDLGILHIDISSVIVSDENDPLINYYTFATCGNNKKIKIWEIKSHSLPKCEDQINFISVENVNIYYGHISAVTCVKYSKCGNFLVSCSLDRTIKIWNNEGTCIQTLSEHIRYVNCIALSKNCSLLASGSAGPNGKSVIVWDLRGNLTIDSQLIKRSSLLQSAFEITNGIDEARVAASIDFDDFILVEKLDDLAEAAVNSCHFSIDNKLVIGSSDKLVKIFSVNDNESIEELTVIDNHTYPVLHVEFSKCGDMLATCSLDGCAIVWNSVSFIKKFEIPQNALAVKDCRFSSNEKFLITAGDDENAYIWDLQLSELKSSIFAHSDSVTSLCFSPDDKLIATVSINGEIKLWNTESVNLFTELYAHDMGVNFCDFSENLEPNPLIPSNGKQNYLLATCGNDSLIKLWTIVTSKIIDSVTVKTWRTLIGHGGNVTCVRFSPKISELVCSGASDKQARVWSVYSGDCIQVLNHDSLVTCCSFNFNCSLIAVGCMDKTLWVWKLPDKLKMEIAFKSKINIKNKSVDNWNKDDVTEWLESIGLTKLSNKFLDGEKLLLLKDENIFKDFDLDEESAKKFSQELKWLKGSEKYFLEVHKNSQLMMEAPDQFYCPITHEIMNDPVFCADGHTYEKRAINEWFMSGKFTSPMTNETLPNSELTPNVQLKNEIHDYFKDLN